jgi:hypothetical protein
VLLLPPPEPLLLPVDPAARKLCWHARSSCSCSCSSNCLAASSSDELTPSSSAARLLYVVYWLLQLKKKTKPCACRGEGSVVGPLLAAHALLLRCAAIVPHAKFYTANYVGYSSRRVICGSGSTCVSVLSS